MDQVDGSKILERAGKVILFSEENNYARNNLWSAFVSVSSGWIRSSKYGFINNQNYPWVYFKSDQDDGVWAYYFMDLNNQEKWYYFDSSRDWVLQSELQN